jgi:hypothetical protein
MPSFTPNTKVEHTRAHGARVVLHGDTLARRGSRRIGWPTPKAHLFVHPYDDPRIIAGQGTIALEMLQDAPDLDTLVVPVGGGGMIAGCAVAARALKPDLKVIGVETDGYSAMRQLLAGEPVTAGGDTIAEGIAVRDIGKLPLALCRPCSTRGERRRSGDRARHRAAARGREDGDRGRRRRRPRRPARHPELFTGRKVGLVLSGGNIDTRLLASVLLRGLVRDGRIVRLRLMIGDAPGQLARVAGLIGKAGGNIVEVQHQRLFGAWSPRRPSSTSRSRRAAATTAASWWRPCRRRASRYGFWRGRTRKSVAFYPPVMGSKRPAMSASPHYSPLAHARSRPDRARLISVSDKEGLIELGKALAAHGVEILSTGGSAKALARCRAESGRR